MSESDVSRKEEVEKKLAEEEAEETPEASGDEVDEVEEIVESDADSSSENQNGVEKDSEEPVENGANKKDGPEAEACSLPQKRKSDVISEAKDSDEVADKKLKADEPEEDAAEAESTA